MINLAVFFVLLYVSAMSEGLNVSCIRLIYSLTSDVRIRLSITNHDPFVGIFVCFVGFSEVGGSERQLYPAGFGDSPRTFESVLASLIMVHLFAFSCVL